MYISRKIIFFVAGSFLAILGVILIAFPSILSSNWARDRIQDTASGQIPGKIVIKDLNASWLGPQIIHGLELKDPEGQTVLMISSLQINNPLFELVYNSFSKLNIDITGMNARLIQAAGNNTTNLQQALGIKTRNSPQTSIPYAIDLNNMIAKIDVSSFANPILIRMKGTTVGENLSGDFDIEALLHDFKTIGSLKANIKNLPVAMLDQILSVKNPELGGMAESVLGDTLNVQISQTDSSGKEFLVTAESPKLRLNFAGNIENLFTAKGDLNLKKSFLALHSKASKIPLGRLCQIAYPEKNLRKKVEAVFGPLVDIDITMNVQNMNGLMQAQLKGSNGQVALDATIENKIVTLNAPCTMEVAASPELAKEVLQGIIPLLGGMLRSENRITIAIDPEGFYYPLGSTDLLEIGVGKLEVDLGQVIFNNEGPLGKIMNALKVDEDEFIRVWFTPAYLSIQEGIINIQRFDMLAMNRYPIAAWGKVELPNDFINMAIGLSGKSLEQATGIPIPIPNYMMQFPLRGKIGNVKIDKTKLTAKIAALLAQVAGGPQGLVIGTVVQLAASATEEKIPEPTTNPLPWKIDSGEADSAEQPQQSQNPLKSLERGAGNLLKNLLK